MANGRNLKRHDELKQLCYCVYDLENRKLPEGYKLLFDDQNFENGFYGAVFRKDNDLVVVYRGTEFKDRKDFSNDKQMWNKEYPDQAKDAMYLYNLAEQYCSNNNLFLTVTGHSLGGSLGEIVGAKTGAATVTFNAYGIRDVLKEGEIKHEDNITNYCSKTDYVIARSRADKHIGKTYVVPTTTSTTSHKLEHMGDLSKAQEIDSNNLAIFKVLKSKVKNAAKTIINSTNNIHDTFSPSMLYLQKANKQNKCTGSYQVSGYTRSDGTKVDSYTRNCYIHGK